MYYIDKRDREIERERERERGRERVEFVDITQIKEVKVKKSFG